MRRVTLLFVGLLGWGLCGCQESSAPPSATDQVIGLGQWVPWSGLPIELMVEDLNGNGHLDLTVMDHGANEAQVFYQQADRQFVRGPLFTGVGFHPGNLFRWPGDAPRYVLSAEGDNALRVLVPDASTGFRVETAVDEMKPRYGHRFNWPGWGESLVISPYDTEALILLKGFDPLTAKSSERRVVPLSKQVPSVLRPQGPITVVDIDGKAGDELLYTTPITGGLYVVRMPQGKKKTIQPALLASDPSWGMPTQVVDADLNGDGHVDLLVPDEAPPGKINVLMNGGKGDFAPTAPIDFANALGITELKTAIDQDGQRYVAAAGNGMLVLYRMPPDWQPGQALPMTALKWKEGSYATALALKDLDGDGWLDVVLGRNNADKTLWVAFGPLWDQWSTLPAASAVLED